MPDLFQYAWIAWLILIIVCVIIELLTLEFTFLMIAAGSVGGLGAELLHAPWWLQIIVAGVLSALLIFTIRPLLLKRLHRGGDPTPSNLDALLGMSARVVLAVGDNGGQARLANGETWTAALGAGAVGPIEVGTPVTVERIQGSTAYVVASTAPTPAPTEGRADA